MLVVVVLLLVGSAINHTQGTSPPMDPPAELCGSGLRRHSQYNGSHVGPPTHGLAAVADCCQLCTKVGSCRHFTWHPVGNKGQPTWCALQADDGVFTPTTAAFVAGDVPAAGHHTCSTSLDCSLAGECVRGKCQCDGWTHGQNCGILNLEPVQPAARGYHNNSGYNSWGGASIFDPNTHRWWLFASQMQGRCPLSGEWSQVSQAVRLHSAHPTGPWTFDSVVVHSEAHNVKPFRAPDGTWLIFYVGAINNITRKCDPVTATAATVESLTFPLPKEAAGPIFIASAATVDAPPEQWQIHGPMTDSVGWHSATNPSPVWIGRNGENNN